ncbi:hypothetical protein CN399_12555 [Bacillus cereus]|uniref:hypothetical protein n=1 Tax=Bacillus cereus TaxID=1396 RepID=UPI000BF2D3D6|nr:hypothetical protein [Bacillus cereus]PFB15491.1 hypothetical protein CN399_12555 [Bacillus cereus]
MKIKEILELTKTKRLSEIAKESLEIGEKKAVEGLKKAGCYNISGKRGWHFDGDESVLEESIYAYAPIGRSKTKNVVNSAKREVSATVEEAKVVNNPSSQLPDKTDSKEENKPTNKQISKQVGKPIDRLIGKQIRKTIGKTTSKSVMKKVTYEIETQLHNELKIKAIREDRTVSDIVNEIIKTALNK